VGDSGYVRSALVGGSYNFGAFKLLGGYSAERNTCTTCTGALARMPGVTGNDASEFRLAQAGVRVPFGRSTLIAQIVRVMDRSNYAVSTGSRDANWFAVGGEHRLSKRTLLYAGIGTVGNQNGSMYALGTGSAQQPSNVVGAGNPRTTTLSLGINHSF
jgi:predicted porin